MKGLQRHRCSSLVVAAFRLRDDALNMHDELLTPFVASQVLTYWEALARKKGVVDVLNMAPSWRLRRGGQREILAADESIADIHFENERPFLKVDS
jgi:hypothetical protein